MAKATIPHDYQGQPVAFDASGWLHATAIAERFGKRLDHWLENAETLAYFRVLDEVLTGHKTGILDTRKSGYVKTSRARADRGSGTWRHPKLAVMFARWLDAKFAVWCDMQIDALLRGDGSHWATVRREATLGHRAVCDAVALNCEARGKTHQRHHFINEARLINEVITGAFAGRSNNRLSAAGLEIAPLAELSDTLAYLEALERTSGKIPHVKPSRAHAAQGDNTWLNAKFAGWHMLGPRAVCAAVAPNCEARGKTPQRHHFINEARLINEVITGDFAGRSRDQLSAAELEIVPQVELRDTALLSDGIGYAERKANPPGYAQSLQPQLDAGFSDIKTSAKEPCPCCHAALGARPLAPVRQLLAEHLTEGSAA